MDLGRNNPYHNINQNQNQKNILARINRGKCLWCDQNHNMFNSPDSPCDCKQYIPRYEYGSVCQCGHSEIWHHRNNDVKTRLNNGPLISKTVGPLISSLESRLTCLEAENKSLLARVRNQSEFNADNELCRVCYKAKKNTVFLPCRHAQFCQECSKKWLATHQTCPICRADVDCILDIII